MGGWPFQNKGSQLCPLWSGTPAPPLLSLPRSHQPGSYPRGSCPGPLTVKCQLPASGTQLAWPDLSEPGPSPGPCRLLNVRSNSDPCAYQEHGTGTRSTWAPKRHKHADLPSSVALEVEVKAYPGIRWDGSPFGSGSQAVGLAQVLFPQPERGRQKPGVGGRDESWCRVLYN